MRQNDEHGADDGNLQDGELSNFRSLDQNFSRKLKSANKTDFCCLFTRVQLNPVTSAMTVFSVSPNVNCVNHRR